MLLLRPEYLLAARDSADSLARTSRQSRRIIITFRKEAAMEVCDYKKVFDIAAELNKRVSQCESGQGEMCDTIDNKLSHLSDIYLAFVDTVREWGRGVFSGRVVFDAEAEQLFKSQLLYLYNRAQSFLAAGKQSEQLCGALNGVRQMEAALGSIHLLLQGWVTPAPSIAPSPRITAFTDHDSVDEARRRIQALPALPHDWKPDYQDQADALERLRVI
jgi:hypothetical protein